MKIDTPRQIVCKGQNFRHKKRTFSKKAHATQKFKNRTASDP